MQQGHRGKRWPGWQPHSHAKFLLKLGWLWSQTVSIFFSSEHSLAWNLTGSTEQVTLYQHLPSGGQNRNGNTVTAGLVHQRLPANSHYSVASPRARQPSRQLAAAEASPRGKGEGPRLVISGWNWAADTRLNLAKWDHKIQRTLELQEWKLFLLSSNLVLKHTNWRKVQSAPNLVPISQVSCFSIRVNRRWMDQANGSPGKRLASARWASHELVPSGQLMWGQQPVSSCLLGLVSLLWCSMVPVFVAWGS